MEELIFPIFRGLGQGSVYALLAAGFVVIYRATDVVNFAQPTLMVLGAYFTSLFVRGYGLPFWVGVVAAMVTMAVIAALIERIALRPMVGQPVFSAAMVTVGLFFALLVLAGRLIRQPIFMGDPWGNDSFVLLGRNVFVADAWKIVITLVAFAAVGLFLDRSRVGLAMRATSLDQEVALAQGVNVGRMFNLSWALSGALAALAGMLVGTGGGGGVEATTAFVALKALPVIILGGLDSIRGALIAGLFIGVAESITRGYASTLAPILGANVDIVVPYLIMIVVLMVRPYGLFGTPEVQRV
ncbi:branched-chain amino acid ABC transporter permease [Nitriliruptor alkaliphilus]|uniref:branched-chain amino acid ABC transporter permease n=1 Tax=Nitriliruptor alkaliphilus TaxID=427918 RepID=UPI000698A12F|nr:branched-chain amino acid ABC transporter permease [Nitriliruptor alkaliphilus]